MTLAPRASAAAIPWVGEGVMKAAADVEGDSVAQRAIGSEDRAAHAEPIRLKEFPGVRGFKLPSLAFG